MWRVCVRTGIGDAVITQLRDQGKLSTVQDGGVPVFNAAGLQAQFANKTHAERALRRKHMMTVLMEEAALQQGVKRVRMQSADIGFGSEMTRPRVDIVKTNSTLNVTQYIAGSALADTGLYVPLDEVGESVSLLLPGTDNLTVVIAVVTQGADFYGPNATEYSVQADGVPSQTLQAANQAVEFTAGAYVLTLYFGSVTVTHVAPVATSSQSTVAATSDTSQSSPSEWWPMLLVGTAIILFCVVILGLGRVGNVKSPTKTEQAYTPVPLKKIEFD